MENVILWLFFFLCLEQKLRFPHPWCQLSISQGRSLFFLFNLSTSGWKYCPLLHCIKHLWGKSDTFVSLTCNTTISLAPPLIGPFNCPDQGEISNLIFVPVTQELSHISEPSLLHLRTQFAEICEQYIKQTDRFPGWKTTKENHHPKTEPGSSRWSHFDISSPTLLVSKVMCCQLAGLIGMEGRRSLEGNGEFHHEHAWLRNGVWSLLAFFAQALAGPFWRPHSLSPPLMVGNRAKYF